jgi:membrane protease YdiL (CAAX protease family)
MAFSAIAYFVDENRGPSYAMIVIAGSMPVAAVVWLLARHYFRCEFNDSRPYGLGVVAISRSRLAIITLAGFALAAIALLLTAAFPPDQPLVNSPFVPLVTNGKVVLYSWLLSSVMAAPLTEEMFFRGILLGSLSRRWPFIVSAAVSATAFVAVHLPQVGSHYSAMLSIGMLGFSAAVVRKLFASLWAAIALHASYNLALSLFGLLS